MTLTTKWFSAATLAALIMTICSSAVSTHAQSNIISSITESTGQGIVESGSGATFTAVTSPVRGGRNAFKATVPRGSERAEIRDQRNFNFTTLGETYWYGWSVYLPSNFTTTSESNIINQWASYPPRVATFPCGGVGHKITAGGGQTLRFDLQHQRDAGGSGSNASKCDTFDLASIADMKGKWTDFVMHAKWTGNSDGFFEIWVRVGGASGTWEKPFQTYNGPTWWNGEGRGPYFKMGYYAGDPNWTGPNSVTVYVDEYKLGNANAGSNAVAPGGDGPGGTTPPPSGEAPVGVIITMRAAVNNKLVAAVDGTRALRAEGLTVGSEDRYLVVGNADDTVSFQSVKTGQYVAVRSSDKRIYADAASVGTAAKFRFEAVAGKANWFVLRSLLTNQYVAAEAAGDEPLIANRAAAATWEQFIWEENW